ncbi:MAG TPA: metallophosphoesterase family protein [Pyrinomonadaceae bacterium]|nr:metallophosphoesterase family protein [Pyrinomonadaceae bacterium]
MRTLVHLSDVHFGRVDYAIVDGLIKIINQIAPHLVVLSGDLTQRARSAQFIEARAFLDKLPEPQIVIPGNHDIPMHNVFARFATPLEKYKKYITDDLQPFYADEEVAVVGINTARSLTVKDGRINAAQIAGVREKMCSLPDDIIKIIVSHHPFDLPEGFDEKDIVGRAVLAMKTLAECGADVFLAGHLHVSHIGNTAHRYKIDGHSALVIQAGTATSTRGRGEANSFNVVRIEKARLIVERLEWQTEQMQFALAKSEKFDQTANGWARSGN